MWFSLFAALSAILGYSLALEEPSICIRALARSCDECIRVSESCGWCSDENFLWMGESMSSRCDDLVSLKKRNCNARKIENPRGSITVTENKPLTNQKEDRVELTQIQPQKLTLALRPGEPQVFELKFRQVEDFPIDLYYLMDLSTSSKENLQNMKKLAIDLMIEMQRITSNLRIGFGSIMPHTSTELAGPTNPCKGNQNCNSYKNVLKLTNNWDEFHRLVSQQQVSGNPDSPSGALDAIMQTAVCEEQIGWRHATRLLVFLTDGGLQLAGDGTLATSVLSNDGRCHLEDHTNTTRLLSGRTSIAHLVQKLSENNIQPIFTVTEELQPIYKELKNFIPKSAVGTLSSNSTNIIKLVSDIYNSLSSQVILENGPLPEGVSITYQSTCKNGVVGTDQNGKKCSNISIGDEVSFQVSVKSQQCVSQPRPTMVPIRALGFTEEVQLLLSFICSCQCTKGGVPNSQRCHHGNGTFECGACKCNEGRVGQICECSTDEVQFEDWDATCRINDNADLCSNNGDCVCGTCECKKRENPNEVYSGRYCECDNFNCDRSNNKLCGGHGFCDCRKCICDEGYTGSACDCSLNTSTCLATNGQICNGRGICECGACKCTDPKFQGPTCEICPTCPGVCSMQGDCVLCRAFGVGNKKETCEQDCSHLQLIKVNSLDDLPQPTDDSPPMSHCKLRYIDSWFYFVYIRKGDIEEIHVMETMHSPR